MTDELAPGTEGATGQGEGQSTESAAPNYAGFSTPEELASAYTSTVQEQEALKSQISNLESLKGRHGNEIGQLRQQLAQLNGQIEGMRSSQPAQQGPTLDTIAEKLQNGEITESQALKLASTITEQQVSTRLGTEFKQLLSQEIGALKQQTAQERAVEKFLNDNPGYAEAFEAGKLDPWLQTNPDGSKAGGEHAWIQYQLQTLKSENAQLKQTAAEKASAAEKAGIDKGIDLAKSKANAGKVLGGKGGQFAQTSGNYDLSNPQQRRAAALSRLNQMRSGTG